MSQIFRKKEPENNLFAAAQAGDIGEIKAHLAKGGYNIDTRDSDGWSLLHHAAYSKQQNAVRFLLEAGADPNAKEQFGGTPLHWACEVGDLQSANELLSNGAAVNACDNKNRVPLADALFHKFWDIVKLLATHDADWFIENSLGNSPFHLVFGSLDKGTHDEVVAILVGAAPNSASAAKALREYESIGA